MTVKHFVKQIVKALTPYGIIYLAGKKYGGRGMSKNLYLKKILKLLDGWNLHI
jgi:hypothetical protein